MTAKKLFITGTGTDVGKTYVSGLILKKLRQAGASAAYYKAAMSGNERRPDGILVPGDAFFVSEFSGISQPLADMCPYVYERAYSPHLAARIEGNPVDPEVVRRGLLRLCASYDYVTMEGSGGILCPIRFDKQRLWLPDLIRSLDFSCLLVADAGLGTINSVGLTACYMKQQNIPLAGMIFNRYEPGNPLHEDNLRMCEELTGVKAIACVRTGDAELALAAEDLMSLYRY